MCITSVFAIPVCRRVAKSWVRIFQDNRACIEQSFPSTNSSGQTEGGRLIHQSKRLIVSFRGIGYMYRHNPSSGTNIQDTFRGN